MKSVRTICAIGMANNNDEKETYSDRLKRQKQYFSENFGCSTSPSFYFIHFHDASAHWMEYSWGWNLSFLNSKDGDPTQCGKGVFGGTALCQKCYKEKKDEIEQAGRKFDRELRENDQEKIDKIIAEGRKTKIITWK